MHDTSSSGGEAEEEEEESSADRRESERVKGVGREQQRKGGCVRMTEQASESRSFPVCSGGVSTHVPSVCVRAIGPPFELVLRNVAPMTSRSLSNSHSDARRGDAR